MAIIDSYKWRYIYSERKQSPVSGVQKPSIMAITGLPTFYSSAHKWDSCKKFRNNAVKGQKFNNLGNAIINK